MTLKVRKHRSQWRKYMVSIIMIDSKSLRGIENDYDRMRERRNWNMSEKQKQYTNRLIVQLRKELHENPEPSMHEINTKHILMQFIAKHTHSIEIVDRGLWFYVVKKGKNHDVPIAFRADYDAVMCEDGCPRHLCGHDGHSAVLAGFSLWLDTVEVEKDVYLIFQPGEETGQGAKICADLLTDKNIEEVYGFHNIPGYKMNEIILHEHTFACASSGMEIILNGKQSHAAYPERGINPAIAISEIIQSMQDAMNEEHKGIVLGTVIGIEAGSDSYGVSAGKGILRLTLRAEYPEEYKDFVHKIENKVIELAEQCGLSYRISYIEEFPAKVNHKYCVEKIRNAARELNIKVLCPDEPFRWSEDFGYYLQKTKGAFWGIGCGENHPGLHTAEYEFEDGIIDSAIEIYKRILNS